MEDKLERNFFTLFAGLESGIKHKWWKTNRYLRSFHISLELTFFCWHVCNWIKRIETIHRKHSHKNSNFPHPNRCSLCDGWYKKKGRQGKGTHTKCWYQLALLPCKIEWDDFFLFTFLSTTEKSSAFFFLFYSKGTLYRLDTHVKCEWGILQLPLETWNQTKRRQQVGKYWRSMKSFAFHFKCDQFGLYTPLSLGMSV